MCKIIFCYRKNELDDYIEWTMQPITASTDKQPPPQELPEFVHVQGPSPRTKTVKTPLEVFQLFFTNAILSCIVQQTILFAAQKGSFEILH